MPWSDTTILTVPLLIRGGPARGERVPYPRGKRGKSAPSSAVNIYREAHLRERLIATFITSTRRLPQREGDLPEHVFFGIRYPLTAESKYTPLVGCFGHTAADGEESGFKLICFLGFDFSLQEIVHGSHVIQRRFLALLRILYAWGRL